MINRIVFQLKSNIENEYYLRDEKKMKNIRTLLL